MNNNNVLLLGLGMQGKAALYDLVQSESISKITVGDINIDSGFINDLPYTEKVRTEEVDVSDMAGIESMLKDVDLIVDLLPSRLSFPVGQLAVEKGVNLVTTTRYILNPGKAEEHEVKKREKTLEEMDEKAKRKGVAVLTQFGLDPGLDLILSLKSIQELDELQEFYSYGAGIPEFKDADNPLKYKFSWSVEGVLKAYMRPARIIKDGKLIDIPPEEIFARENMHTLQLEALEEEMECYCNGDVVKYAEKLGIKEKVNNMARYTGRWPGHRSFWEPFVKCGFLDDSPVKIEEKEVEPRKFVAEVLSSQEKFWYGENERDIALIRMDARGIKDGKKVRNIYQILDKRDLDTGFTAMQRTVGFTASIGAQLILNKKVDKTGMLSPFDISYEKISDKLKTRGIKLTHEVITD